jgi:hypothetical protein
MNQPSQHIFKKTFNPKYINDGTLISLIIRPLLARSMYKIACPPSLLEQYQASPAGLFDPIKLRQKILSVDSLHLI